MAKKKKGRAKKKQTVTPRRATRRGGKDLAKAFGYGPSAKPSAVLDKPLRDLLPIEPIQVEIILPVAPAKRPVLTWRQQGRRLIIQVKRHFLRA